MAIQSYADLTAAVADYLERGDLTSQIETFVQLGEAALKRRLRVRTMEFDVVLTGAVGSASLDLPANFAEPRSLWWDDGSCRVALRPALIDNMGRSSTAGRPEYWGVDGGSITFERPCDQAYNFVFRFMAGMDIAGSGGVTALLMQLSPWQPANYVLLNYPDAYLHSALEQAYIFLRDNDGIAISQGKWQAAVDEINAKEARSRANAPLRTEVAPQMLGSRSGFNIRTGQ